MVIIQRLIDQGQPYIAEIGSVPRPIVGDCWSVDPEQLKQSDKHEPDPEISDIVGERASSANAAEPTSAEHNILEASHKTDVDGRRKDARLLFLNSQDDIMSLDRR